MLTIGQLRIRQKSIRQGLIVGTIVLFGTVLRVVHLAFVGFAMPFRYGGLFLEFSEQIIASRGGMPIMIPFYTDGGIPFAYPPLSFYIEAALISIFPLPDFLVVNLLPPLLSVLALLSFYYLARELGLRSNAQLAALVAYAAMPAAFQDQIEGAGLAEALGTVVLIWFAISLLRTYKRGGIVDYVISGALWALCMVSSPGSAYASIPMMLIFATATVAKKGRQFSARDGGYLVVVGTVALVASSPYWLSVVSRHGIGIFVGPFIGQNVEHAWSLSEIAKLFINLDVSGAPHHLIWDAVILIGVVGAVFSLRWGLVAWFIALYAIPREGVWLVAIPGALLAGLGWGEMLSPMVSKLGSASREGWRPLLSGGMTIIAITYITANVFFVIRDMVVSSRPIGDIPAESWGLTPDSIDAMNWAQANTPDEGKFIVLSRPQVKEWTPHIARRTVLNMPFGSEWEPDERVNINSLESALFECDDFDCLQDSVSKTMGYQEVFVIMERNRLSKLQSRDCGVELCEAEFELLWLNDEIAVGRLSINAGPKG